MTRLRPERCNEHGCTTLVERRDAARCGGILFGVQDGSVGCGHFFCDEHMVGSIGPYYCRPCRAAMKAAADAAEAKGRAMDLILAASRGAYVAVVQPTKHLGDAARAFGYEARTATGDAFETAFEWARENMRMDEDLQASARAASRASGDRHVS